MGAVLSSMTIRAPPPKDVRVERCIRVFSLDDRIIATLWALFLKYDKERAGKIPSDEFFKNVIKYQRNGLSDSIFLFLGTSSEDFISFGEFVEIISTFCCFEQKELLTYFFFILDQTKAGLVEKHELKQFIQGIWYNDISSNTLAALEYLEKADDGDGSYNFHEIALLQRKYPGAFFPLYNLQTQMIENTLGNTWWQHQKAFLNDRKEAIRAMELKRLQEKEKAAAKESEEANDAVIMKRMGIVKFYLMPWLRAKERAKLARIAAIEMELEAKR